MIIKFERKHWQYLAVMFECTQQAFVFTDRGFHSLELCIVSKSVFDNFLKNPINPDMSSKNDLDFFIMPT